MRTAYLLMAAAALAPAGCSSLIVNSGQDLSKLTTRAQVHEAFGPPAAVEPTGEHTTEEFTTRRKIAEPYKNIYLAIGYVITLGLGELIWFPHQLYVAGRRSIVGQHLRFSYDSEGRVTEIRHDGDAVIGVGPPRE